MALRNISSIYFELFTVNYYDSQFLLFAYSNLFWTSRRSNEYGFLVTSPLHSEDYRSFPPETVGLFTVGVRGSKGPSGAPHYIFNNPSWCSRAVPRIGANSIQLFVTLVVDCDV